MIKISRQIVEELSISGLIVNSDPSSLCNNHSRPVCFMVDPGAVITITGSIIGCELEVMGKEFKFKIEIDKRTIAGERFMYFQYDNGRQWLAVCNDGLSHYSGVLKFGDVTKF